MVLLDFVFTPKHRPTCAKLEIARFVYNTYNIVICYIIYDLSDIDGRLL